MKSPLAGKRVVVTRALHQAGALDTLLRDRGAEPLRYPCIAITLPEDSGPLDCALNALAAGDYDWLVLTSVNAVFMLAQHLEALGIAPVGIPGLSVAAIGPVTAAAIRDRLGLEVALTPERYVAEALVEALRPTPETRILLPQSEIARPVLAQGLAAAGAEVKAVAAYRTVLGSGGVDLPALFAAGEVDAITLTSSSTVRYLLRRLENEGGAAGDLTGVCLACIGPITARTARELGLSVTVVPEVYTLDGLVSGLETYFSLTKEEVK